MSVEISGMFGRIDGQLHTYFAGSPVVINVSGLEWGNPVISPFTIVRVEVIYNDMTVGEFREDTGGQTTATFDISSALMAIWSDYNFANEVETAQSAVGGEARDYYRPYRQYSLRVHTEYLSSDDGGVFTQTSFGPFEGGQCALGGLTERERSTVGAEENADVSYREHENLRNGDASTKPSGVPERVGMHSITSWVDHDATDTVSIFYPADAVPEADTHANHAPIVLRDTSQSYVDFLFVNRRGAVETCSALMKEAQDITDIDIQQYASVERPAFKPSRSLIAFGTDGRRTWQMSSGYVSREWAEWWAMEFLGGKRKKWWMRYPIGSANGTYVPVVIKPSKNSISIYDRSKQQMPHVDFTVTMALEG